MTFEELFTRASDPVLHHLVGRPGVRLLSRLDPGLTQPSKLREVALGLRSPQEMLLDKEIREELFLLLPEAEARDLSEVLGIPSGVDPYGYLSGLRIQAGSRRYLALLDFFSLEEVDPEVLEEKPTVELVNSAYPLFAHQRVAADEALSLLQKEPKRAILHMPTGSGKTRTAMHIIAKWLNESEPMLVIWLADSQELCEQAVE